MEHKHTHSHIKLETPKNLRLQTQIHNHTYTKKKKKNLYMAPPKIHSWLRHCTYGGGNGINNIGAGKLGWIGMPI